MRYRMRVTYPAWVNTTVSVDADDDDEARNLAWAAVDALCLEGTPGELEVELGQPFIGPMTQAQFERDPTEDPKFLGLVGHISAATPLFLEDIEDAQ